jgi:hypothetical protein
MSLKNGLYFIELSRKFIFSVEVKIRFRCQESDFIRDRKLNFGTTCVLLIRLLKQNIQLELYHYLSTVSDYEKARPQSITASAFVQSRKKVKPEMFYELNKEIAGEFYKDNDEGILLYKNHRLLAIDGSTIYLPVNKDTKRVYGTFNNQNQSDDVVIGRVSLLYDVLNDIALDSELAPYSTGETELGRRHFLVAKQNDIIIMDRAYPGFRSIYDLHKQKLHFVIRTKTNFSTQVKTFYESGQLESIIDITPSKNKSFLGLKYTKSTSVTVRLIRIELSSGETEILMTSLLDHQTYPHQEFQDLYFKRWGVETYYDRFKNIIGVERFSGTSTQFIQQEFYCAVYLSNMQSILSKDAQRKANEKYKNRKYEYKINSSMSLSFLREKVIQILTSDKDAQEIYKELTGLFTLNVVPKRSGRSFNRNPDKYRNRKKPKQFNNRRSIL